MPITISLLPSNVDGSGSNLFYAIGTLAFSGNYTTGGDTLDFTQVADKLPSTIPPALPPTSSKSPSPPASCCKLASGCLV